MVSQAIRSPGPARRGFTLIELLVAMAMIILIMGVLSQAFVEGLEAFRQLKGIGDLNERLRTAVVKLRTDVLDTNRAAERFIRDAVRMGAADPTKAAALRAEYAAICVDAADLDTQLRLVERQTVNPIARQLLRWTLEALEGVKEGAERMAKTLVLIEQFGK